MSVQSDVDFGMEVRRTVKLARVSRGKYINPRGVLTETKTIPGASLMVPPVSEVETSTRALRPKDARLKWFYFYVPSLS